MNFLKRYWVLVALGVGILWFRRKASGTASYRIPVPNAPDRSSLGPSPSPYGGKPDFTVPAWEQILPKERLEET